MALTPNAALAVAHAAHRIALGGDSLALLGVLAADALSAMAGRARAVAVVLPAGDGALAAHASAGAVPDAVLLESGPALDTATTGAVSTLNDTTLGGGRWPGYAATARAAGVRGVRAWPVQVVGRPLGALVALSADPWGSERSSSTGQTLADLCSVVLQLPPQEHRWAQVAAYLQSSLGVHAVVHQAIGMLISAHHLTADAAATALARQASSVGVAPEELASRLVDGSTAARDVPVGAT